MAKVSFKPQTLRGILVVLLVLIVIGGGALFYLGIDAVRQYAIEVNHTAADANASGKQVEELQGLKGQLAGSQSLITKADQMFTSSANYQAQAASDVRNYAAASGLTVTKTSFEAQPGGTGPVMTVALRAPVSYTKLITFLNGIEGNVPKMQVTNIDLSHVIGGSADSVNVNDIKITVATR